MKKVLLITFIVFCIFQMLVMATAIDIGSAAIDRNQARTQGYTVIDGNNPANESGTITSVEIWANVNLQGCEVAIFTEGASNVFTTRDTHSIGNVTAGSKQTFSGLSLDVVTGDYIGLYWTSGSLEMTWENGAPEFFWKDSGDQIPCTDNTFVVNPNETLSLYGTGATPSGITWNTKTISKWNTATITKWNGM